MMMTASEPKSRDTHATCPIHQMSFGEIVRYLQQGYEAPVQRALASHVKYCNVCAAEVERVQALCQAGHHVMSEHLEDFGAEAVSTLDDADLAAYVDGVLSGREAEAVARQIAGSHASYLQYTAVVQDLGTPVEARYRVPAEALAAVRIPVPQTVPAFQAHLRRGWARLRQGLAPLFASPWRPALALALGVLVMLVVWPRADGPTVVPLAGPAGTAVSDEVLSGAVPGVRADGPVLVLTPDAGEQVVFTWPAASERPVDHYLVQVYDAENAEIFETSVTEPSWTADTALFAGDVPYSVLIMAVYQADGGRRLVSRQVVQRHL